MTLERTERRPSAFRTAEEYINHYGIFPHKETRFTLTYYTRSMASVYEWEYFKKTVNVRTGVYKCYRLARKPSVLAILN